MRLDKHTTIGHLNKISDKTHPYISQHSRNLIKKYGDEDEGDRRENMKELWANLLMDAITILKINDSREKIHSDFQENKRDIRTNFEAIFQSIRKTSSYGIEELRKYLDDFVDFESVLYGSDNYYRDHINHVIQVWAIGLIMLDDKSFYFKLNDDYKRDDHLFHYETDNNADHLLITQSEIWAMWTIIALCHDLGYPIEQASKINEKTKQIIRHFGRIQFTELEYNFSILSTFLVEKFLKIISSKVVHPKEEHEKNNFNVKRITSVQTKFIDKFSKSLEDYKHGIFSSLLLFKDLTYFLETDFFISEPLDVEDARQFYIRKEILRSIASHTCRKLYHLNLNTLSFLLILCDELQEWDRPRFEEIIRHSGGGEPKVDVELTFPHMSGEDTGIQKIHIKMEYEKVKRSKSNEQYMVKKRFRDMTYLLRGAKNDRDRNIDFEWIIKFEDCEYFYRFNTESVNSFEQLSFSCEKDKDFDLFSDKYNS